MPPAPSTVLQEQFLLAKLQARDPHAWRKMIAELYPLAISIANQLLQSHTDAEDITQQALIALSEPETLQKAKICNTQQLRNFFAAIVRNKSKDFLRRKTAQRRGQGNVWNFSEMENDDENANKPYDRPTNENLLTNVENNELLDQIKEILTTLPERQQQIIDGFYLRGLTYTEISETYNIPVGSIGVYLSRALSSIRSHITKRSRKNSNISVICPEPTTTPTVP